MFGLNKYKYNDLGKITFLLMVDLVETPNNELYNQFIITNINDFVVQHLRIHVYIAMERMWAHLIFRGDVKIHQGPSQPFSHYCQLGYIILPPFTLTQDVEGCDTYYQFASILYLDKPAAFSKEHRSLSHKMPSTNINNWIDKLPLTNIGWAIMITLSTLMCF